MKDSKDLIGMPLPLKSLTEYQAGSIVSRMVINKKSGTVTAFAFERGEGLSEHSSPHDALVIVLEGEAEIPIRSLLSFMISYRCSYDINSPSSIFWYILSNLFVF